MMSQAMGARARKGAWWVIALMVLSLVACGDDGNNNDGGDDGNNGVNNDVNNDENNDTPNNDANNDDEDVRESVFPISYVANNRSNIPGIEPGGKLMLVASDGSAGPTDITPEGIECNFGCQISQNLDWFLWIENDGMNSILNAAPITDIDEDGATVDLGSSEVVSDGILAFETAGDTLVYETTDFEIFAGPMPGLEAQSLGVVGSADMTQGGFYLAPDGNNVVAWTVTLSSMTMVRFDLDAGGGPLALYTLESTGFGGTGSFYGPREKMAMSPDGRYLAVASNGLVDTNPCQNNNECIQPEACGANARCTSQRLTINMIDLQNADKLGQGCTSGNDCGASHFCDFADPQDPESGRCLPGILDLGAAGPQNCNARQDGEFTKILGDMTWSGDSSKLYILASEDCSRFNIPRVAVLRTDPTLSSTLSVIENPGADFAVENCYDAVEDEFTVGSTTCVVDITEMALSADGNTVVFSGSSPSAAANIELYTIDRLGKRDKVILTSDLETEVEQLQPLDF